MSDKKRTGISSITIENFKGIGAPQTIDLKPITLLFGANSAGKTTILQSLVYLREVLKTGRHPEKADMSGHSIDFGRFEDVVHNHNLRNCMSFSAEISLGPETDTGLKAAKNKNLRSWLKEMTGRDVQTFRLVVEGYRGSFNVKLFIDEEWVWYSDIAAGDIELNSESSMIQDMFSVVGLKEEWDQLNLSVRFRELDFNCEWAEYRGEHEYSGQDDDIRQFMDDLVQNSLIYYLGALPVRAVIQHLSTQLRSLGPLRTIPQRNQQFENIPCRQWYDGLAAWRELEKMMTGAEPHNAIRVDLGALNGYPSPPEYRGIKAEALEEISKLELGYAPIIKKTAEIDIRISNVSEKKILQGAVHRGDYRVTETLLLTDVKRGVVVHPCEVGTGVSQALPIAVGAFAKGCAIMTVEQPELHLHPRLQCDLADVFVANIHRHPDRRFLIETHSEHLILRLLRRIRETSAGEQMDSSLTLTPDDVGVLYVGEASDGVRIQELRIGDDGQFIDEWPGGFFEEGFDEIVGGL
jgi:hypothetical protein